MELYLIRHGPTDYNRYRRWQGRVDIPLSPEGRSLADAVRNSLHARRVHTDLVFSSPLSRAQETARLIASDSSCVVVDDRLIEIDLGEYDGRLEDEVQQEVGKKEYELWRRGNFRTPAPGGESFGQVQKRVGEFLGELRASQTAPQVLIVAHQVSLMALKSVISGACSQKTLTGYRQRTDVVEVWDDFGKSCMSAWEVT
ncbi:MAG: histidine phosphatase family protein [Acidiferrobacterales bacterium]|nr:histidine phosphatase family protein [Acidiferrobacterales bacterium]